MTKVVLYLLCKPFGKQLLVKEKGTGKHNYIGLINVRVAMALIWLLFIEQSKCVRQHKEHTESITWILRILYS